MTPKPYWKQDNPRDQAIAVLNGARGHISNAIDGYSTPETLTTADNLLADLYILLRALPPGEWTNDPTNPLA